MCFQSVKCGKNNYRNRRKWIYDVKKRDNSVANAVDNPFETDMQAISNQFLRSTCMIALIAMIINSSY
jgi:hypothetical protein